MEVFSLIQGTLGLEEYATQKISEFLGKQAEVSTTEELPPKLHFIRDKFFLQVSENRTSSRTSDFTIKAFVLEEDSVKDGTQVSNISFNEAKLALCRAITADANKLNPRGILDVKTPRIVGLEEVSPELANYVQDHSILI